MIALIERELSGLGEPDLGQRGFKRAAPATQKGMWDLHAVNEDLIPHGRIL